MGARLKSISNFSVTDRCNGRCTMCNIWNTKPRPEHTLDQIEETLTENRDTLKGLNYVQLTGGEPFLRDDLSTIVSLFHDLFSKCMIWIPTNGLLPETITRITYDMLQEADPLRLGVTVSLDGDAEVNDAQRGIKGSFKQAVTTIKSLVAMKKHGLRVTTGFTLTEKNYVYAPIIQKMVYRLGSEFSFRPVNISEHYYKNPEQKIIQKETVEPYLDYMAYNYKRRRGLGAVTNLAYVFGAKQYLTGERSLPCSAGTDSLYIDTVGDVYPCIVMNHRLGNIYQQRLDDILSSPMAEEAKKLVSNLECPNCWVECEVYRELRKDKKRLLDALYWMISLSSL